ncbi:MAG: hypothetical protein GY725_14895 [bacterium]|nr:hypothetical protein [bacterium]
MNDDAAFSSFPTLLPKPLDARPVRLLELCACQEQLAQGCAGTAIGVNMHIFGVGCRLFDLQRETPEVRAIAEPMLKTMGENKSILSGSFSETGVTGAYLLPQTTATKTNGGWRINGSKAYNSNVPAADVNGALVRVEDGGDTPRVAMLMLLKDTEGVVCRGQESWDADFNDVFIPDAARPPIQPANTVFANMTSFGA